MELLFFWVSVLAAWIVIVAYGSAFLEKKIDKLLDLWFYSESGQIKPKFPCYPCYLDGTERGLNEK